MVENVPFTNALARIIIELVGYGNEALSTLFFVFGLSSLFVGCVFYLLGRMELSMILHFFPSHVLVGCIGGIGIFIARTGLEEASDTVLSFSMDGWESLVLKFHLLALVFAFEGCLRMLTRYTRDGNGTSKFPLLSPMYFCSITPAFYAASAVLK